MAAPKKKVPGEYDAAQITILEGLEAVRKRPGMYIGSTGERGLHHLVWEVVDNAVDESMAGHATTVTVVLREDGSVEVADDVAAKRGEVVSERVGSRGDQRTV